jgi:hypothetical protein
VPVDVSACANRSMPTAVLPAGCVEVLGKALSVAPLCITAPEE